MARNALKPPGSSEKKEEFSHSLDVYIVNNVYVNIKNNI